MSEGVSQLMSQSVSRSVENSTNFKIACVAAF